MKWDNVSIINLIYTTHMNETTPRYFVEFEKKLNKKLDERFDSIDEQLAEVTEWVTTLEEDVKDIKEEVKASNRRADRHSEKIMIGIKKLDNHETRIDKLEKELV